MDQEPVQTARESGLVIRKIPILDRPESRPKLIRYTMHIDEVGHCADKLRRVSKAIQRLTDEYRIIISTVMRSNKRPMALAVKRQRNDLSRTTKTRIRESNAYIEVIATQADSIHVKLHRLQKDYSDISIRMNSKVYDHLLTRVQQTILTIVHLRNEFAHILNFVILHTRLTHCSNNSAVKIYQLNISLRWCLSSMIETRQQYQHNGPVARSMSILERKLVKLRAYGTNFFHDRKGISVPYIRQRLTEMEGQKSVLRNLKLTKPLARRERASPLAMAQHTKNKETAFQRPDKKEIHPKTNAKTRRVSDAVQFRYQQTNSNFHMAQGLSNAPRMPIISSRGRSFPDRRSRAARAEEIASWLNKDTGTSFRKYIPATEPFSGHSTPLERQDGIVFRKYISLSRRERVESQWMLRYRQTERKRRAKGELVSTVREWLREGGVKDSEGSESRKVEHVFGEVAARDWYSMPGADVDNGDDRDHPDFAREMHREGGYVFGGRVERTRVDGSYTEDIDDNT
jgi:hypothetical protein